MTNITDTVVFADSMRVTDEGYLEAAVRTARTGVQHYLGHELGRPDLNVVGVYRPESEVFAKRSLDTFSKLPMTNDHPKEMVVNSKNWKDTAVGVTGDEVLRDGEYLKIGLRITDADAVAAVRRGKRELSVGYSTDIVWQDGVAPDGTLYQAVQRNIVANHIALVDRGRAGHRARIGDASFGDDSWGAVPIIDFQPGDVPKTVGGHMTDQFKTVVLGDKAVQVAVTDVAAVEAFRDQARKQLADAEAQHTAAVAMKDEEIGKLRADLKAAQDAAIVDVDALVAARTELVGKVKALDAKIDPSGKTDAELRKVAVAAKLGDAMVKDASDAEIVGMFKALTKAPPPTNPVADAFNGNIRPVEDAAIKTQEAYNKSIHDMNAWRNQGA